MEIYPDSVRRVSPPKTTMPNTLAALPSSQYPTALELESGKRDADLRCLPADRDVSVAETAERNRTLPSIGLSCFLGRRGGVLGGIGAGIALVDN